VDVYVGSWVPCRIDVWRICRGMAGVGFVDGVWDAV
jgi:hypothetical protein